MKTDILISYLQKNRVSLLQEIYKEGAEFKEYDRFPQITLPKKRLPSAPLSDLLGVRSSKRDYVRKKITKSEIGSLLYWSAGLREKKPTEDSEHRTRMYPSGGAKYPLELYLVVLNVEALEPGVYHYNVKRHSLEFLHTVDLEETIRCFDEKDPYTQQALQAGFVLLFSFIKTRNMQKYGTLSYKLSLIEAGCITQNIYLVSEVLGLGCCSTGLNNGSDFNTALKLDGVNESIFYGCSIGNVN